LDIRWNPGGQLQEYLEIADYLLPEGLLITQVNRDGEIFDTEKSDADAFEMPLVVLCNNYTASAGDLLTAAVQDYGTGVIVGETTFGKGIVQTIKHYPEDGSLLYFTTAEYLTPSGRKIHGIGVTPDIEVTLGEEAEQWMQDNPGKELPNELDQQLQTGISALMDKMKGVETQE
jgi:carboxyl-terminal processing protease